MLEKEKNKTKEMNTGRRNNRFGTVMDISNELRASVKYHGDEDILMSSDINTKNIKKDLLLFKDEILKDIKRQQIKLFEKAEDNEKYTIEKIEEFNIKIQKFSENINNLSNMIITDKTIREKVESLIEFKNKNQELMTTTGVKIDKKANDNIASYKDEQEGLISDKSSSIPVWVVPTNEELMIIKDTYKIVQDL